MFSRWGEPTCRDAVPMSLGSEFHGLGAPPSGEEIERIREVRSLLLEVNLGATAIGTSVTAAPGYPELATRHLSVLTGIDFVLAKDLVEETSDTGVYVELSGVLKRTSTKLTKICNDLRLLASGPRCGFNEINLPQLQPGSSIMPGKVNPVIPEVVNQTVFFVIGDGHHGDVGVLGRPASAQRDGAPSFPSRCSSRSAPWRTPSTRFGVSASTASRQTRTAPATWCSTLSVLSRCSSPCWATSSAPISAREGHLQGKSLHQIVVQERKLLTQEKWDEIFSFENLVNPEVIR